MKKVLMLISLVCAFKFNLETNLVIRHQMPSFCLMEKICLNGYHWKMERKWMPNGK